MGGSSEAPEAVTEHASDRRREVEDDGVQAGIDGTGEQRYITPTLALFPNEPHHMGNGVGSKAEGKHQQLDVGQRRQNADEVDIAKEADEERYQE